MPPSDPFVTPSDDLVKEPRHRVVAAMPGVDDAAATVDALVEEGFAVDDVLVLCGEEGVRRLDPTGRHHGLMGRLVRAVDTVASAGDVIKEYAQHIEKGGVVISAPAHDDEQRKLVQRVFREHQASHMRYYGAFTFTDVS